MAIKQIVIVKMDIKEVYVSLVTIVIYIFNIIYINAPNVQINLGK